MKNKEIKQNAKMKMKRKYGYAILATILWSLVSIGSWTAGLFIGAILVSGGLIASKAALYLDIAKDNFNGTDNIYRGFNFFFKGSRNCM